MKNKKKSQRRLATTSGGKDKFFNITVKLLPTKEVFTLKNIYNEMKISDLKNYAEFATGIPRNIQRLRYLDEGDLLDHTDVRHNDIVPGGQLQMDVWHMWRSLTESIAAQDNDWVLRLGVTQDSDYNTPNSEYITTYMGPRVKRKWLADRAFVALYIASHRGQQSLCEQLIEEGANVNERTPLGRTPLHVAAARGHGHIIDLLLERGANINAEDKNGETALTIAAKYGHKGCERHLFLFRWQQRAKECKPEVERDMFAHQFHDSALPVWLKGDHAQIYFTQILPPGEYSGSALNAPKRNSSASRREDSRLSDDNEEEEDQYRYSPSAEDDLGSRASRRPTRAATMPAIREETAGGSASDYSRHGSSKPVGSSRQGSKKAGENKSFDAWLIRKKKDEEEQREIKRRERELKKIEKEKRRIQDSFIPEKSHDQWLAEKERASLKQKTRPAGRSQVAKEPKTMDEIIRNIMLRKQQEEDNKAMPYGYWMSMTNSGMRDQIRAPGTEA